MRKSLIMNRIRAGQPAMVVALCSPIPWFARYAKEHGFDGVWLETEHHLWDYREIQAYLAYHQACDIDCMVRPANRSPSEIYRFIDNGATGIMIPHVESPEEAQICVNATKFSPLGDRGVDGYGLDTEFGLNKPDLYFQESNRERFLSVMLESPEAIRQADAIAAVPGVDVLFIGPADLLSRMDLPLDITQPAFRGIQKKVAQAARTHGKAWGCPCPNPDAVESALSAGATFVVLGSDFNLIMNGLEGLAKDFKVCRDRISKPEKRKMSPTEAGSEVKSSG